MNCSLSTHRSLGPSSVSKRARAHATVWLLLLSLFLQSVPLALAGDGDDQFKDLPPPAVQSETKSESESESSSPALVPFDPEKSRAADIFIANQDQVIEDVLEMAIRLEERIEVKSNELGADAAFKMIVDGKKDPFRVEDAVLGAAEPTTVKNVKGGPSLRVTRVMHKDTGIAFLVLPPGVDPDSDHIKQYIARMNLTAGENGRHVMLLRISNELEDLTDAGVKASEIEKVVTYHAKPATFKERMKALKVSIWAGHPDKPMLAMASIFAGAQVLISGAMGYAQNLIHGQGAIDAFTHIDAKPAILSLMFGMVIGSYSSTWKNFTNMPKSKFARTVRNSILSFSFAYGLKVWTDGGFEHLSIIDSAGLLAHASIWLNVVVNNITKDYWAEFSRIREEMGLNRGKVWNYFQRTNFEYQTINLGSYTLKMLDLVAFSVSIPVWGAMKLGKAMFLASMFYVQYGSVKYAEKMGYERAPQLRARWEDFKRLGPVRRFPKKLLKGIIETSKTVGNFCSNLLSDKNATTPPFDGE